MHLPEIVIAGRSNVGKSSFINAIANNSKLARVSSTPGKTRTINLYHFHEGFMLVDLPGYGYAEVSKKEKDEWAGFIEEYLSSSKNIVLVILLVDIRHDPTPRDETMVQYAHTAGLPILILASKCDKVSRQEKNARLDSIRERLHIGANDICAFSSRNREGLKNVTDRMHVSCQTSRIR